MDRDGFWNVIAAARASATTSASHDVVDALTEQLEAIDSAAELEDFDRIKAELLTESYTWKLWGAAYTMCGGCSDDGFDYFRGWLIVQGRDVFDAAMADPDSLADAVVPDGDYPECESFWYAADKVYELKVGHEMPRHRLDYSNPGEDVGDFDDEDAMAAAYPRLFAKYGNDPL